MIYRMRKGGWLTRRSWPAIVLVAILLTTTGGTLLHWHKSSADPGCQLCHIRHLPRLDTTVEIIALDPRLSQWDFVLDHSVEELELWLSGTSSRAPPVTAHHL
jgi:hypothetical protein